jgi:UbiD family decarboxylase
MSDLRNYLALLREQRPDDFVRITKPVSADREPAALLRRIEETGRSPVLFFERVGESAMPMVTNVHATRERLALALGVDERELNRTYQERLGKPVAPVLVDTGPVQEVVTTGEQVNLHALPLVRPSDNTTTLYIGGGILVARDPETGVRNLSYNRLMVVGKNRFTFHAAPGLHLAAIMRKAEARGEALPVAIVLGVHPAFALGTLAKVPFGVDEYTCAGAMLGEPVKLVRCKTVPVEAPADAEIVIEGRVPPGVRELEGPYDEFTGFAQPADMQTAIEVTAITHRRDAIHQDIFGGGREHLLMGAVPKEATLEARLKAQHPAVTAVRLPLSGCGRLHAYAALGPHGPAEARRVILSLFSMDHFLKHVWVVDQDVDIRDDAQVLWAMSACIQGGRDTIVLERMLGSSLDPSAEKAIGDKVGFDCTRKRADFPPRNHIDEAIVRRMDPTKYT